MTTQLPTPACDCHTHVFGPYEVFPLADDRPYTPYEASLADLDALHARLGVDRVVLVQPSPYGTDNACLVDALGRLGDRGRGVAVVPPDASAEQLDGLHAAGVRGTRVNLASYGAVDRGEAEARLRATATAVARLGWHVQVYAGLADLVTSADVLAELPVPVVLDHFAMARAEAGPDQPGLDRVLELVASGQAYVKLSAPHRLSSVPDHPDVAPLARAFLDANADRALWGTDWPHTEGKDRDPGRRLTPRPFRDEDDARALERLAGWTRTDGELRRVLVENPARLYRF